VFAVELELRAAVLGEEDAIAFLDLERLAVALVGELACADGNDCAFLRLFLGGIGNDEAAGRHLFLGAGPDDHAVADGLDLAGHERFPPGFASRARIILEWRAVERRDPRT